MLSLIKIAWERWQIIGTQIGDFNARILMTAFYFSALLVFGIRDTWFADPLKIKAPSFDTPRSQRRPLVDDLKAAQRQF